MPPDDLGRTGDRAEGRRPGLASGVRRSFTLITGAFDGEVFTLSDMVVEAQESRTGTVLGFNGTTEWALDATEATDALWLPREDQLRVLLGLVVPVPGAHRRRLSGDGGAARLVPRCRCAASGLQRRPDAENAYW